MGSKMVADSQTMHISKKSTSLLKGIAIFLVLFDHIGENVGWLPSLPLGAVGVYIFLFLSGYGLMRSATTNGIAGYWEKRIKKVYLPYIVVIAFCAVLSLVFLHKIGFNFIKYLMLWEVPFGEYWYLRIQIEWYIAFFIIWIAKDKFNISVNKIPVLICIADLFIVTANITVRNFAWTLGAFLLGGGYTAIYGIQRLYRLRTLKTGMILTLVAVVAVICKKTPYVERHELGIIDTALQLVIVFCIAVFIVLFADILVEKLGVLKAALLQVGSFSYEIYLTHSVYLDILRDADSRGRGRPIAVLVFIALTAITTISLKCLMSLLLRRKKNRWI